MKFDKIYANGCSFMWGHGHNNPWYFKYFDETKNIDITSFLEESKKYNQQDKTTQYTNPNVFKAFNEFDWVREKYNYVNRVAENIEAKLINESIFGGSLHRLFRKTVSHIMETSDDELKSTLFILELPPVGRGEMYFDNQGRYCNFAGDDNFDFIEDSNFEFIQNWYDKSFKLEVDIISEFQKLYLLINLLKSKNINFIFIKSGDRMHDLNALNSKYATSENILKIQKDIDLNSVLFDNEYSDMVHWFSREKKATFKDDCPDISFDGHNSIRGSKLISEQILNHINKTF
jgi:hypothetical protein